MARMRMGDLLILAGLITESDLRVALAQQKQHGGKLGEHLVRVNLLTEEALARALAQQLGLQYNDLAKPPMPAVAQLLPEKIAARLQALPTAFDPRTGLLTVAVSDPLDDEALAEVARFTSKQIIAQVTPANLLRRAIEHAYFGVELHDEGTAEFQLMDIHGRGKTVRVDEDQELPELGTSEMMPITDDDIDDGGGVQPLAAELPPVPAAPPARQPMRIAPAPPAAPGRPSSQAPARTPAGGTPMPPQPRPAPAPPAAQSASNEAGDEALKMVWAIAELLIERGYFTRAELMRNLRGK